MQFCDLYVYRLWFSSVHLVLFSTLYKHFAPFEEINILRSPYYSF